MARRCHSSEHVVAWISAAIEAIVVAIPAMVLRSVVLDRRPLVHTSDVVRRLLPTVVVVGLVVVWNDNAGEPQDWGALERRAIFVAVGALLVSGSMRRRWALPVFACLPAIAAGLVRWTTGLDGRPAVVTDPTAAALTVAFCCGAVWVFAQPAMARAYRRVQAFWTEMVADDAARRDGRLAARTVVVDQLPARVSRPSRAGLAASGGRHRQ